MENQKCLTGKPQICSISIVVSTVLTAKQASTEATAGNGQYSTVRIYTEDLRLVKRLKAAAVIQGHKEPTTADIFSRAIAKLNEAKRKK